MVLTILLRIVTFVIDTTKEARGGDVRPLLSFIFSPSINWAGVIMRILNTQDINIGRQQVIGRSRMFIFESWKNYIIAHVHGHCNILCGGPWLLCLCMNYFIFSYFLQIVSLGYFQIWLKDVPLCSCVFCILNLKFNISDDIGIFPYSSTSSSLSSSSS